MASLQTQLVRLGIALVVLPAGAVTLLALFETQGQGSSWPRLLLAFAVIAGVATALAMARIRRWVSPIRGLASIAEGATSKSAEHGHELDPAGELEKSLSAEHFQRETEEIRSLASGLSQILHEARLRDQQLQVNLADAAQALERSQEAEKLKSQFLANVSHELRTPLNAIINVPKLLLEELELKLVWKCEQCGALFEESAPADGAAPPSDELGNESDTCPTCQGTIWKTHQVLNKGNLSEQRGLLRRMEQSASYLLTIVNDVLDFSKLDAGKQSLMYTKVELDALLTEVVNTAGVLTEREGLELVVERSPDVRELEGDHVRLTQVLMNLVGNAVKFTPKGGRIVLRVRRAEHEGAPAVLFEVEDSGIGIPADQLPHVFDSFRQVDGSHTRKKGGTGLGLAISKGFVELHGGRMGVASDVGKGTTFHFVVPERRAARAAESPTEAPTATPPRAPVANALPPNLIRKRPAAPAAANVKVIVFDDDPLGFEQLRAALARRPGLEPTLVSEPSRIVDRIREQKPALVVVAVGAGNFQHGVVERLKESGLLATTPTMLVGALDAETVARIARALGAEELRPAPSALEPARPRWNSAELVARIEEQLSERS